MVRPYDPSPILKKLATMNQEGFDTTDIQKCCPTSSEVRDAKDFKPYIQASLNQIKDIMDLEVKQEYGSTYHN